MRVDIKKLATAVVDAADGKTAAQVKTLMEGVVKLLAEERVLGKWRQLNEPSRRRGQRGSVRRT